ncbi:MAG: hypothetical protein KC912_25400, partial [Proteobacteria bacterium]|nr:hypothetical protein [Pseudomonadota bacterium]
MLLMLAALVLAQPLADEPGSIEFLEATDWLMVREQARADSPRRGRIAPGYAVAVVGRAVGPGCEDDWLELVGEGFACSTWLTPTEIPPEQVPRLVAFDHPEPDEYEAYRDGDGYDRTPLADAEALVPFIYGKRWRSWHGRVWASAEHYGHGDDPIGMLPRGSKHAFVAAVDTARGQVLLQEDGTVVPADEVFLYPIDRFAGRRLSEDPVPEGRNAAWAHRYAGARVRAEPRTSADVALILDYHAQLEVDVVPASEDGHWWRIPDALGDGVDGFADDRTDIRHWVPSAPVEGLAADAVWLDID